MQETLTNKETTMKALMVTDKNLTDIEEIMPRLARSIAPGEVAEIANINSRSQVFLDFFSSQSIR
jgi:[acyl-carrier-protein] S-malonyltransferase